MESRRQCVVALLLVLLVVSVEAEFEGFIEEGLEKEELDAPVVTRVTRLSADDGSRAQVKTRKVDPLEFWDEDEFEGLPEEEEENPGSKFAETIVAAEKVTTARRAFSPYLEVAGVLFFVLYGIVYWIGRRENERIALAWATEFAGTGSILEKNFSLLGFGDAPDAPSLVKEGMSSFKFYASGRRHCESLLATLSLKNRQDLLSQLLYLVVPSRDEITVQVNMDEDAMDPLVFAVAQKRRAKDMQREAPDLQQFAAVLAAPASRRWVADDLAVISESRELAVDLLPEPLLDQVLSSASFPALAPYFLSLHFSDQFPESKHKKILQFHFVIPPVTKLHEMKRLVALVPYFIDVVGRYKMSGATKAKAVAAREKLRAEEYKELSKARQEALQRKKAEQQTPMSSKKEEKERLRQLKKSMPKVKMSRGH